MAQDGKIDITDTELIRSVLENELFGIYIYDGEKFLYFNKTIEILSGYDQEELYKMSVWDLLAYAQDKVRLRNQALRRLKNEKLSPFNEFYIKKKNGELLLGYFNLSVVEYHGKKAILGVVIDITEKKKYEDLVEQYHKTEMVSRITSHVYHDFNNYLTVISGYLSLIKESLSPGDSLLKHIEMTERASEKAISLTNDLLLLLNRQELSLDRLNLEAILESSLKLLDNFFQEKKIGIERDIPKTLCDIVGDYVKLEQVFLNIFMNSIDSMPDGGTISIRAEYREITAKETSNFVNLKEGRFVQVTVSDTGQGIEKTDLTRVWEPFYTTKTKKTSGLGLSIVFGIIMAHHGDVFIESDKNKGTTVTFYLPCFSESAS
jgi:two-component system, cell cycle sensor histidine kinase and response regulator CckA